MFPPKHFSTATVGIGESATRSRNAGAGLVLYFIGAIVTHLRVRDYRLGNAALLLIASAATLATALAAVR